MSEKNKFDGMSDASITGHIIDIQDNINSYQRQIDISQDMLDEYIAERDRRALDAYWAAHPELEPVAVGDKLCSNIRWDNDPVPTRQEVSQIDLKTETGTVRYWKYDEYNPRYYPDLPLAVLCDGRSGYLRDNPPATGETEG